MKKAVQKTAFFFKHNATNHTAHLSIIQTMKIAKIYYAKFIAIACVHLLFLNVQSQVVKSDVKGSKVVALQILNHDTITVNAINCDMIEAVFYVKNNWLDDHIMAQLQTDCHCVTPILPPVLKRNQTDSITLVINTNNIPPGPFLKQGYLESPDDKLIHLVVKGNITVVKPIIKQGQPPIIYKPKHIRVTSKGKK